MHNGNQFVMGFEDIFWMPVVTLLRASLNGSHKSIDRRLMTNSLEIASYICAEAPHLPQNLTKRIKYTYNRISIRITSRYMARLTSSSWIFELRLGEVAYLIISKPSIAAGL